MKPKRGCCESFVQNTRPLVNTSLKWESVLVLGAPREGKELPASGIGNAGNSSGPSPQILFFTRNKEDKDCCSGRCLIIMLMSMWPRESATLLELILNSSGQVKVIQPVYSRIRCLITPVQRQGLQSSELILLPTCLASQPPNPLSFSSA